MLIRFVLYGLLGWCVAIVWSAVGERLRGKQRDWRLLGHASLWLFPLFGLLAPLYEPVHEIFRPWHWFMRGTFYGTGFWAVEFAAGWLLRRVTGSEVVLINDLEATGYGIPTLRPEEFFVLSLGRPDPQGNAVLIAPGTGLGEGILFWDGSRHRPSPSEGGHCTFAARTALEIDFKVRLQKRYDHVSFDRVVSGSGLRRLYNFLQETGYAEEPDWLAREIAAADDPAVVISRVAIEEKSELCVKALDMWTSIFGTEAGNLALKALATAGVYVGGGIAPKILPKLKDGTFLTAFHDKGRLSSVLGQIPVRVILNDKAALYGTAFYALEHRKNAAR